MKPKQLLKFTCASALSAFVTIAGATNLPESDAPEGSHEGTLLSLDHHRTDPNAAMIQHDAATAGIISSAPFAKVTKNLAPAGRGERIEANATTDVWALGNYAYTGTFNEPCGGEDNAGIFIWDVHNKNKVSKAGFIASPDGSRANDVRATSMNSGDVLVHSNESCGGGPGGFEIYNVDDPTSPVHLASVQTDDVNLFLQNNLGFTDFGVHNLWLFSQGANDYVAATVESEFGNFQIFDITDPAIPTLVGFWGAEQLFLPETDWVNLEDFGVILDVDDYLISGFGASQNRFLHDVTINADGTRAYLANWDAGLILLDISDPSNPTLVSVAIDPANGSLDGEVNSHSVWPSADGSIVVEGEEDFSAWEATIAPGNVRFSNDNPIPGVMAATSTGDAFEGSQTGNVGFITESSVEVTSGTLAGSIYGANEFSQNSLPLGAGTYAGNFVWIGRACNSDAILNTVGAGDIAVVRRGACSFSEKSVNAFNEGAGAIVVTNNNAISTPWSGIRVWNYSDPANPILASTFDTECSASTAPSDNCDARGTYSSHNVFVESKGNKVKAYVSWYTDGVVVVDVTDPYNPVETARYHRAGAAFESVAENGGIQDIWGIYKQPNSPWIFASDRNGGLYVLKEYGAGSAKKGKK